MGGAAGLVKTAGDLYGLASGNMDNAASELGRNAQEYWNEAKSDPLKAKIAARKHKIDAEDSTLGKAWVAAKETLTDPALALDTVAENAATMVPGMGAGRLAAGANAARGFKAAQAAGHVSREAAQQIARRAGTVGTAAAIGVGGVQQGADVAGDIYGDVYGKRDAEWDASPQFQQALADNGGDREAAKRALALSTARGAFVPATAISLAANALPGAATLERALVGGAARETIKDAGRFALPKAIAKGALGEGAQETIEEGGGRLAANVAAQNIAIPQHDTWDQVGESAGLGFAGGFLLGGAGGAFHRQATAAQQDVAEDDLQPPVQETPPMQEPPSARGFAPVLDADALQRAGVTPPPVLDAGRLDAALGAPPASAPAPVKPSEAMGLNPQAGPLSASAALAVDSGAAGMPQVAAEQSPAQERPEPVSNAPAAGIDLDTGEIAAPADTAAVLAERLKFVQEQARASGWDKQLVAERNRVRRELARLAPDAAPEQEPAVPTWDTLQPGQRVKLYRGESSANDAGGQWWTTDRAKAQQYGAVTEVELPAEAIGRHAARGHNGADEFVFPTPDSRPQALAAAEAQQPAAGEKEQKPAQTLSGKAPPATKQVALADPATSAAAPAAAPAAPAASTPGDSLASQAQAIQASPQQQEAGNPPPAGRTAAGEAGAVPAAAAQAGGGGVQADGLTQPRTSDGAAAAAAKLFTDPRTGTAVVVPNKATADAMARSKQLAGKVAVRKATSAEMADKNNSFTGYGEGDPRSAGYVLEMADAAQPPAPVPAAPKDKKREAALARVNSPKGAFFMSQPKAQAFIKDNGLADTHELRQQNKAWHVVAKAGVDEAPSAQSNGAQRAEAEQADTTQSQSPAARDAAAPAAAPAPAAPKPAPRGVLAKKAQAEEAARADYFAPGNIVRGYDGSLERVLAYSPPDAEGIWSVRVMPVERSGAQWRDVPERARTHSTAPTARELKDGPVERAPAGNDQSPSPAVAPAGNRQATGRHLPPAPETEQANNVLLYQNTRSRLTRAYNGDEYRGRKEDYAALRADLERVAQSGDAQRAAMARRVLDDVDKSILELGRRKASAAQAQEQAPKFSRSAPAEQALPEAAQQFKDTERAYGGRAAYDRAKAAGKTKLAYGQWVQVRTPNFKAWFGDWESDPAGASKVVDPDTGEPMVVYHGGTVGNVFSTDYAGSGGGRESAFFFTPDIRQAKDYAGTGSVKEVFISLRDPVETDVQLEPDEVVQAKADGKDGYWVIEDGLVEESEIAVFSSTQVKSATNNNGNFDGGNPDIRRSFAGQQAATADQHALASAQQRLEAGEDAEAVRRDTGWHRGADGKWRFEISDADARLKVGHKGVPVSQLLAGVAQMQAGWYRLADLLDHPALFAAYPDLAAMPVKFMPGSAMGQADGRFNPSNGTLYLHEDLAQRQALSTLLHEVQHGIQNIEGFATGGSPSQFAGVDLAAQAALDRINERLNSGEYDMDEYDALLQQKRDILSRAGTASPRELYRRLAGEVEARNTQARQKLTDEQRSATPPGATADVADTDVIVTFNGQEMASAPMPANAAGFDFDAMRRTVLGEGAAAAPSGATTTQVAGAIRRAYGSLLDKLQAKGLVTLVQSEDEAVEAAAQARAAKTGEALERARASLMASVQSSRSPMKSVEANIRRGREALARALDGKTSVHRAMYRNGLGWVDFVWGDEGGAVKRNGSRPGEKGIAHILEARQRKDGLPEAKALRLLDGLIETIANGAEVRRRELGGSIRAVVGLRNMEAIVVKTPGSNAWMLTGWEVKPDATAAANDTSRATHDQADSSDLAVGAGESSVAQGSLDIKRSAAGAVEGFFDPVSGQSFLVADGLSEATAPGTLMHEVGIHMAADGTLAPLFERAQALVQEGGSDFLRRVKARMESAGEASAEEAAAYIVTEYENARVLAPASVRQWVRDVTAAVRAWLFRRGVLLKAEQLTVADVAAVARANARTLAQKGRGASDSDTAFFGARQRNATGTPTDRAVMDMVREGKSASDILGLIAGTSKSRFNRQVARLLLKTGTAPDVAMQERIWDRNRQQWTTAPGVYQRDHHRIVMTPAAAHIAEQVLLHEMVHAATLAALDRKGLHSLQMRRLFEHVKKRGGAAGQYGMKNVREFVAEAFTNPDFQRALKGMDAPAGGTIRNAWDGFVRILRSILGLPQSEHSALSRALELGVAVMREDMQLRQRGALRAGMGAQRAVGDAPPAEAMRVQQAIEGKSLLDAARFLTQSSNPAYAEIAGKVLEKLQAMQRAGVNLSLHVVHVGDSAPQAMAYSRAYTEMALDAKGRDVAVWVNGADVTGKVGTEEEALLHELVHAATAGALLHGSKVAASPHARAAKAIYEAAGAISEHISRRFEQAEQGKATLTAFEQDMRDGRNNAFRDMDEVVAWALTNREAQQYLDGIPYQGGQTLWTRFVQAVRSFLGLEAKADSVLSEVLAAAEQLMDATGTTLPAVKAFWHKRGLPMITQQAAGSYVTRQPAADQTQTEAFKQWYGDWQNAAHVPEQMEPDRAGAQAAPGGGDPAVNRLQRPAGLDQNAAGADRGRRFTFSGASGPTGADGAPVRLYHGTKDDIRAFDLAHPRRKDSGWLGEGVYLTSNLDDANQYARAKRGAAGPNLMPLYANVRNPYQASQADKQRLKHASKEAILTFTERLKARGHDGVVLWDEGGDMELVAFKPTQVKSATGNNGNFDPEDANIAYFGAADMARNIGEGLKSITRTDVRQAGRHKLTDWLKHGLQFLGRRQLVDIYGDLLPMREYDRLAAQMEADKNETGADADDLARRWSKLLDEGKLADLMHDATLAQIDADSEVTAVAGDDRAKSTTLKARFKTLTPEAQQVYRQARDSYSAHHAQVRDAIRARIMRSELGSAKREELLKRMDNDFFKKVKGVYFPLARFGKYVVAVKDADGMVASVSRAETMAEAEASRQELLKAFPKDKGFAVGRVTLDKEFVANHQMVGRGFMTELYRALDGAGMDSAQLAELEDTLGQLYLLSLPDLSWAKHGIHRKGTPGFSQDARRAFAQNTFHGARYLAKLRYGDLMQDELDKMQQHVDDWSAIEEFDQPGAQRVVDEMRQRHDAAMNPKSNPLSTALTSFGFLYYLGLSPAAAVVNLSQTALVAYPVMAGKWGYQKAGAALLRASKEAVAGKNDIRTQLKDKDEIAAYDAAVKAGVIDVTQSHDLAGIAQGEDSGVMWKIRPVMRAASFLFHHAERFNRQATFIAAYRLARETGAAHQDAYEQAAKATYDGHFDYASANRPRIMQGNVARVVLLFKQFAQNMIYTLGRQAYLSVQGESPEVRREARKVFAGLITTHAMGAGVLGLPLVGPLLAMASMLGSDADEPWDAEVALRNMMAEAMGTKAAEVVAKGVSRLTPWDISGRIGLDNLIFPDVREGLEGQRWAETFATGMLGPVVGMGVNAAKAAQKLGDGDYQRALEDLLPVALRNPIKAARFASEGAKDRTGIPIKDEVGAAGVLGQAVGFAPSEVRLAQEGKTAVMDADRRLNERRAELLGQFARAAMKQDAKGMQEANEAIARFNEKNPGRRITAPQKWQSVRRREQRIREAEDGVYLPKKRRDALEAGGFAFAGD